MRRCLTALDPEDPPDPPPWSPASEAILPCYAELVEWFRMPPDKFHALMEKALADRAAHRAQERKEG